MHALGQAFESMHQLRQLKLSDDYIRDGDEGERRTLRHMSALTNLTSLTVPRVRDGARQQFDVHH
jgi:hypothetical protein